MLVLYTHVKRLENSLCIIKRYINQMYYYYYYNNEISVVIEYLNCFYHTYARAAWVSDETFPADTRVSNTRLYRRTTAYTATWWRWGK